jgi:hypothetical protein
MEVDVMRLLFVSLTILLIVFTCSALDNNFFYPRKIDASSYLSKNDLLVKDNYHPYYVNDDNPNTAWVEGAPGDGIGEYIILYTTLPKNVNSMISIRNGYQKSEGLFNQNNRVKDLQIEFVSGTANKPKITSQKYTLKDEMGWQQIDINPEEEVWGIDFMIQSVYKGTKYDDTCISDIKITFENQNLIDTKSQVTLKNQYVTWFAERSKVAVFFKNLPKDYPFKAYKITTYKKNVNEDGCPLFDLEYLNGIFQNEKLSKFISSPAGMKYIKMLNDEKFSSEKICSITPKSQYYLPEMLSSIVFVGISNLFKLPNLKIIAETSKTKTGDTFYKVLYVGKNIRAIDWKRLLQNRHEELLSRYYYDDEGKLFYIGGQFAGEDGECLNDALFVWDKGKITRIFWFFVQYANKDGIDYQLTVYE